MTFVIGFLLHFSKQKIFVAAPLIEIHSSDSFRRRFSSSLDSVMYVFVFGQFACLELKLTLIVSRPTPKGHSDQVMRQISKR